FAQVVSERLGIPLENVSVVHGDTDKVQFGMGTYGSRSGAVGISAIVKALDKIEAKAKKVAAHMLEVAEGDIVFEDGKFTVAGTDKSAAWGEVALNAYIAHKFAGQELEPGLKEGAFYDPTNFTFPAGCHICEVEVDPQTGESEIVAWTAVDDFGTVVNPMIVEGQVHGGNAPGGVAGIAESQRQTHSGIGARAMYAFTQHRPATVRQAASLLTKQEEAKLLAGGHTLIPTMKLRLAGPKHLVDLSKVEGLS